MHLWHSTRARRFAAAAVTRMIRNIEFLRIVSPPDPAGIHVYELPETVEEEPPIKEPDPPLEVADQSQVQNQASNENDDEERPAHVIDWWAEARRLTQELDEEALDRWLLEQGYDRYVSIMQGPLPITNR